ncbi:ribosomal protein S18-alanine N-acetyltransferase [Actinocorallia sp. API 0066]|uniref:ribosomal protein S18-alanine N-acetyltransferase n=1 Tax=Actinocorallia sp. API 0066 TaxID=2896846 RepID=UPI001E583603|nr:ribosomal protein S18-alanine N-acetyltransferase [Actinocorallia sp. API 0066]MCD0447651.1 ribosomal protein S18-alanine N-acetyltransferase [Actinocorallia sp. API 0066]
MTDPVVRPMTTADLPAALKLEHELFGAESWTEEMLLEELAAVPHVRHYVVLEDAGEVIGYAGLASAGGDGDVQTIGVRAVSQGRGLGAVLLTELLDEARRRGCRRVFLEVRADNTPAQRLYEKFGFHRIGVRKRYYQPSGVDAIMMRRDEP